MTVFGMVFERHSREFPVVNGASLARQALAGNPADPCNNVDLALYTRSDPTLAVSGALVFRMTEGPVVDSSSMHSRSANRQTLARLTPSLRATREA